MSMLSHIKFGPKLTAVRNSANLFERIGFICTIPAKYSCVLENTFTLNAHLIRVKYLMALALHTLLTKKMVWLYLHL